MRTVLLLLEGLIFSSFFWILNFWLVKTEKVVRWELNFIKLGGLFFLIMHLLVATLFTLPSFPVYLVGTFILLLCLILLWWTVLIYQKEPPAVCFSEIIVTPLKTKGPYSLIRHPLYTAYMLAWLGGTIATGCWLLSLSFICMAIIYRKAAIREEAQWLAGERADSYQKYINRTGMFIPKIF